MKNTFKAFIIGVLLASICTIAITKLDVDVSLKKKEVQAQERVTIKPKEIEIDKEAVFGKMKEKAVLIGLEKEIVKTNGTDDSMSIGWGWFDEELLSRRLIYEARGTFYIGMDLTSFTKDDILINNKTGVVTLRVPAPKLIVLDLPYENASFTYKKGFFRKNFTKKDEQLIWESIRETAEEEIKSDLENFNIAREANYDFIRTMLGSMPGVKDIIFVEV